MSEPITIPRLADVRERLAENQKERRVLRSLLRVVKRADELGNPGRLIPEVVGSNPDRRATA